MIAEAPSEVVIAVTVTPRLFDLLGRSPTLGRPFQREETVPEVLLSHGFWQRRFGGNPNVIGQTVQIGNFPAPIIGVMPQDFTFPYGSMLGPSGFTRSTTIDMWLPMAFSGPLATANRMIDTRGGVVRDTHWLGAIGRMKPGISVEQVQADLSTVAGQLAQTYPDSNGGWGATVVPVLDQTVGTIRGPLLVLLAGVAFVLIIATVNVANLVLARSIARQKEFATRVALGAGRTRVIQQALTEGLVLALAGGAAGLLLARWGVSALLGLAPADLPRVHEIAPDARMLWLTLGVSLVTGVFVGLLPAISASRVAPHAALQENSRGTVGGAFRRRARATLVVAELALAVTLTIGAGLLFRSFVSLLSVQTGFQPEQMLTWQMNLPQRIRTQDERTAFYSEFLTRMKALPGVVSVGGTTRLPLGSTGLTVMLDVDGRPRPNAEWPEVQFRRAIGDYFQTMRIPLLHGRLFNDTDGATAPSVCVINQAMAAKLFPGEEPVGKRVRICRDAALDDDHRRGRRRQAQRARRSAAAGNVCEPLAGLGDVTLHRDADDRERGRHDRSGARRGPGDRSRSAVLLDSNHGRREIRLRGTAALRPGARRSLRRAGAVARGDRRLRRHVAARERAHAGSRRPSGTRRASVPGDDDAGRSGDASRADRGSALAWCCRWR